MQVGKDFSGEHLEFKVLSVSSEQADAFFRVVSRDEYGMPSYECAELIRGRKINYRGELLVCAGGEARGFVRLVDIVPEGSNYKWLFDDPREVIEEPVQHNGDLSTVWWDLADPLWEYPRIVSLDGRAWERIQKQIKGGGR